ncbi:uncharacterized protein K489DRAFT_81848 [Dissoconium aciculare CBS 342.82]|uniref:Uncharacterized protein n=1 Tax=Dissoconium aciculare CBS 342.82 TaxID=1314786 RepID=A0A6J3LT86_9PEZI|nr:uncharacterized protein K489DRAFT_81848 [Dissoconium aciculare CBS 342.82]KAF1818863.1 hypothetical protein K489DRAFT_81848 [Dissoconium aciculare CBS 342.82]
MSSVYFALFASLPLVLGGAHVPLLSGSGSISISIGSNSATTAASYPTSNKQCVRDSCARQVVDGLKQYQAPARSSDCAALFKPVTVTPSAVTKTVTRLATPATTTLTSSVSTATIISSTTTTTTTDQTITSTAVVVSTDLTTVITTTAVTTTATTSAAGAAGGPSKRGETQTKPPQWACDCSDLARFSSACACAGFQPRTVTASAPTVILTVDAVTPTSTIYAVGQTTVGATATSTVHTDVTNIVTSTSTTQTTTSTTTTETSTTTTTIQAAPTGAAYCASGRLVDGTRSGYNGAPASIGNLRIEGRDSTVYEGPILSGPRNVTTPSGGTHLCDATNNNANPNPSSNGISILVDAANLCEFPLDGSYSNQFEDFFITKIGDSDSNASGNQFWGILKDNAFTPAGGCETAIAPGETILWAFNAFNVNFFLGASPSSLTLSPGQAATVSVVGYDGNGGSGTPIAGASFNGQTSDANGQVVFVAPTAPGTYRYKATRSDSIRSNAVVVVVQ